MSLDDCPPYDEIVGNLAEFFGCSAYQEESRPRVAQSRAQAVAMAEVAPTMRILFIVSTTYQFLIKTI